MNVEKRIEGLEKDYGILLKFRTRTYIEEMNLLKERFESLEFKHNALTELVETDGRRLRKLEEGNESAKAFCGEQIKINDISREYFRSNENRIIALEDKLNAFLEAYKMVNSEREHNGCNYSIDMEVMSDKKSCGDCGYFTDDAMKEEGYGDCLQGNHIYGLPKDHIICDEFKTELEVDEDLEKVWKEIHKDRKEEQEFKEGRRGHLNVSLKEEQEDPDYISVKEHERILNRIAYDERVKFMEGLNEIYNVDKPERADFDYLAFNAVKERLEKMIKFYEELEKGDDDEINELFEDDHMGNTGGEERIGRSL